MKMQGTQTVKSEGMAKIDDKAERVQDEDPAHHIDPSIEERYVAISADLTDGESKIRLARGDAAAKPPYLDADCWNDLVTACKNVFFRYEQSSHKTWKQLCQDVCERHGEWLAYRKDNRQAVFERIATNVLVYANKLQPHDEGPTKEH